MAGHDSSTTAILYALGANLGIAIAKFVAWGFTGSGSMLAEAIHSTADCSNQLLLFWGLHRAKLPPDQEHPLGYGKAIFFWSFMVAILLFSVGGLFSIYEGWHKMHALQHAKEAGEGLKNIWIGMTVLGVSIVLESFSLYGAMVEINKMKSDKKLWDWLKASRNAELVVIWGEDVAALMGLVVAFIFLGIAYITGDPLYDALGSMAIGALLIGISIFLTIRVKALLIGRSADPDIQAAIEKHIGEDENIIKVLNCLTMQIGPQIMLAVKIEMNSELSIGQAAKAINAMELSLRQSFPEIGWCFVEPDVTDK